MRILFLYTVIIGLVGCDAIMPDIKVTNQEPVVEVPGEDGLTVSQRFLSRVTVHTKERQEDGSVRDYRYVGTKLGDDLVLTSMMANYRLGTTFKVRYTTTEGVEKETSASYFTKESRYWLLILKTSEILDIPSATLRKDMPTLGEKVYVLWPEGKQEFKVHTKELRYNGARFRVWPKEDPKFNHSLRDTVPIFTNEGFVIGFTTNEKFSSHTNYGGYGSASTVVYPSWFVDRFYQEAIEPY